MKILMKYFLSPKLIQVKYQMSRLRAGEEQSIDWMLDMSKIQYKS